MCNFWSAILTRKGKVIWDKNLTAHEELIKKAGLKDDKLEDRDFIRFEIAPKNIFSKKKEDWAFKIDEEGTLPSWYSENMAFFEGVCWEEWKTAMAITLWKLSLASVKKFIAEVKKIKYFSMSGKIDAKWHISYGETWDAARNAARNAAWNAAWNAAGDAAWNAARNAAGDAAWNAAWNAAVYARFLAVAKLNFAGKKKHFAHAKARMEVWKRGYGLRCDVNGKLYVYAVKKAAEKGR